MAAAAAEKSTTPECDKMAEAAPKSQAIGEFLEWLQSEKGVYLGKGHEHDGSCKEVGPHNRETCIAGITGPCKHPASYKANVCGMQSESRNAVMYTWTYNLEELLAEFFSIDMKKVEKERRAILDRLRAGKQ
ncbi:MAG: hypothetical protein KGJ23_08685 [Euryarchaeota archaeon]|nr:hypothetical protein [Euryarchaeota archaeon]MDE1836679.1 hypothetical protein [Euryarchaeota archaeon]MDE1880292.1 hypothetical protein [Euryarchaeota archaeon]MDE2044649.1 hypothetical protein [Thermoplasmata archaeon]